MQSQQNIDKQDYPFSIHVDLNGEQYGHLALLATYTCKSLSATVRRLISEDLERCQPDIPVEQLPLPIAIDNEGSNAYGVTGATHSIAVEDIFGS